MTDLPVRGEDRLQVGTVMPCRDGIVQCHATPSRAWAGQGELTRHWNRKISSHFFFLLFFCGSLCSFGAMRSTALAIPLKKILVIHNYNPDYPAIAQEDEGLREVLLHDTRYRIIMSFEYLNVPYFDDARDYIQDTARYLGMKYSIWKPDIVLIADAAVLPLYKKYLQNTFEKVPVILSQQNTRSGTTNLPNERIATWGLFDPDYDANLQLMMRMFPKVGKFYIVLGTSQVEQYIRECLTRLVRPYQPRVTFEFVSPESREAVLQQIAGLAGDTAIFYVRFGRDRQGESHVPARVLDDICRVASVPVFVAVGHLLGTGAIGGYVLDLRAVGRMAGMQVLALLDGKDLSQEELQALRFKGYAFDWRALARWDIAEDRLPQGSRIEFREYGIWELYGGYVLTGLVLIAGELFLVVGLIVNRMRRRKAEAAIVRLNASLERKVKERTHDLWEANTKLHETAKQLAVMNAQLDRMSRTDGLTGLYNRRHMDERLAHEQERYKRTGVPFSVLLVDIDLFKRVNDTYGHDVGDTLLRHIAVSLTSGIRKMDTVSRWGGEEFLLLLPATDRNKAMRLAQRIRGDVSGSPYRFGDKTLRVTITIGLSTITPDESLEALLKRADDALYAGKEAGRDRVVAA